MSGLSLPHVGCRDDNSKPMDNHAACDMHRSKQRCTDGMQKYTGMHACMHACMHIHIHIHLHIHIHRRAHLHATCTYAHTFLLSHTYTPYIYIQKTSIYTHIHTCICRYIQICDMCIHLSIHICMNMHEQANMHMRTSLLRCLFMFRLQVCQDMRLAKDSSPNKAPEESQHVIILRRSTPRPPA